MKGRFTRELHVSQVKYSCAYSHGAGRNTQLTRVAEAISQSDSNIDWSFAFPPVSEPPSNIQHAPMDIFAIGSDEPVSCLRAAETVCPPALLHQVYEELDPSLSLTADGNPFYFENLPSLFPNNDESNNTT